MERRFIVNKIMKMILVFTMIISVNLSAFAQDEEKTQEESIEIEEVIDSSDPNDILEDEEKEQTLNKKEIENNSKEQDDHEKVKSPKKKRDDSSQRDEIKEQEDLQLDLVEAPIEKKSRRSGDIAYVRTWEAYVNAYNDESVKEIKIESDIVANADFTTERRVSSVLIDGNHHRINTQKFRETLFKLDTEKSEETREIILKNISVAHNRDPIVETGEERGGSSPSNPSVDAKWSIQFNNFSSKDSTPEYITSGLGIDSITVYGLFEGKARYGAFKNDSHLLFKDADVFIDDGIVGNDINIINSKIESYSRYGTFLSMGSVNVEKSKLNLETLNYFAFSTTNTNSLIRFNDVELKMENISELTDGFDAVEIQNSKIDLQSSNFLHNVENVEISNTSINQDGGTVFSHIGNAIVNADIQVANSSYLIDGGQNFRFVDSNIDYAGGKRIIDSQKVTLDGTTLQSETPNVIDLPIKLEVFEITNKSKLALKNKKQALNVQSLFVSDSHVDIATSRNAIAMELGRLDVKDSFLKINSKGQGISEPKKMNLVNSEIVIDSDAKAVQTQSLVLEDTEMDVRSKNNEVVYIGGSSYVKDVFLIAKGDKTKLKIESSGNGTANTGALAIRTYDRAEADNSGVLISEGAKVKVETPNGAQGFYSRIYKGKTKIDGRGTEFSVVSERKSSNHPVVRYRLVGFQTFEASNHAKVNFVAEGRKDPVVRMYGDGNKFIVKSQASVKIHNKGNGFATNPGLESANQGLLYTSGTRVPSEFILEDQGSSMEIIADYGAAIDGRTNDLLVSIGAGTNFVVDGNTAGNRGVFYAKNVSFTIDSPQYYDFRNRSKGGGPVIDAGNSAYYESNVSDLAVWKKGANLEGNPYKTWSQFSFKLSGKDLDTIIESDESTFNNNEDSFGKNGMSNYTRISGNNARPIIDFVRPNPYDTDRYIYGHASVPEGLEGLRNAWTDEVHVTLRETLANGKVNEYQDLPTVGMENGNSGYPVYDTEESERGGYFRLDLGKGNLAEIGAKYEVISAYRGDTELSEKRKLYAAGPFPEEVTVTDKTPPKVAEVKTPIYEHQKNIRGQSLEKNVRVYFAVNGKMIKNKNGEEVFTTVDEKGEWNFDLEPFYDLQIDDKLQIILEDKAGNRNPLVETPFHDIVKEKATTVTVEESKFVLEAKERFVLLQDFEKNIHNDQDLMELMDVKAYEKRETIIDHDSKIIDRSGLDYENPKSKSYTIRFAIRNHEEVYIDQKIHILPYDNIVQNDEYFIVANNFYDSHHAYKNKDAYFIEKASAKAYRKDDLTQELIVSLQSHDISEKPGSYPLTFYIKDQKDIKISVSAHILNRDHVVETTRHVIAANDFEIMEYEAVNIQDEEIIRYAKAYGFNKERPQERLQVIVRDHDIQSIKNIYHAHLALIKES